MNSIVSLAVLTTKLYERFSGTTKVTFNKDEEATRQDSAVIAPIYVIQKATV